jgi:hypothetical protein
VDSLVSNSLEIQALCDEFRHLADGYRILSFYETALIPGARRPVVDQMSAVIGLPHEEPMPLARHHADMVRFEGDGDPAFLAVCRHLEQRVWAN